MLYEITSKDHEKVERLQRKIEKFRIKLRKIDYINDQEDFFCTMHDFWDLLKTIDDERLCKLFIHSKYYQKYNAYFESLENYYTRAVEVAEAFTIITKQISKKLSFLDLFDRQMSKETYLQTSREIKMLDFKNCKKLVIVGCGCLPETILYIYENTPIKEIIGLDNNQEAIYIAGEMIRSQKLSNIHLLHYSGMNYDYSKNDIVLISNMVRGKKKILDRIVETAQDNVQILIRTPILLGHMFYENALDSLNKRLVVIKSKRVSSYFLENTVLMKKLHI